MSLINEALKKAQRLRTEQTGDTPPLPGGRITKRGQARSSQTIVLFASGAIVLVVLSVVVTFWLANRPSAAHASAATASAAPIAKAPVADPAPLVVPPAITPAPVKPATDTPATTASSPGTKTNVGETKAATPPATPSAANVASAPPPTQSAPPSPTPTPTTTAAAQTVAANPPNSAATTPAPAGPTNVTPAVSQPAPAVDAPVVEKPVPAGPPKPDERIAAFVEAVRVTAIRASDNKVMMNDRMYRVNDIVERSLGVKLIKVAADSLTFADANGVTYVKFF